MFMNYYIYILYMPFMIISNILVFSMNSWISMWMIMEINMITFMLILFSMKNMNLNLLMIYFIFQTINSYMYMYMSMLINLNNNLFIIYLIMNINMFMKMSIFPIFQWYIFMIKQMSWMNIFILSVLQKIIPLNILSQILLMNYKLMNFNTMILLISMINMSLLSLNFIDIKMIMTISSMSQLTWMVMLLMINEKLMWIYYFIYSFMMYLLCDIFHNMNIHNLKMMNLNKFNIFLKMIIIIMMMIFASLPPFSGFLIKWFTLQTMTNYYSFYIITIMIFCSLLNLFMYFRISYNSMTLFNMTYKINYKLINFKFKINYKFMLIKYFLMFSLFSYQLI